MGELDELKRIQAEKEVGGLKTLLQESHAATRLADERNTEKTIEEIKALADILNDQTEFQTKNTRELSEKLEELAKLDKLDEVTERLDKLAELHEKLLAKEFPNKLEVSNLHQITKQFGIAVQGIKIPDNAKALNSIMQAVSKLLDVTNKDVSQSASDYVPYRRVVMVGNRMLFDDQPTPADFRGGSGGSSGGGGTTFDGVLQDSTADIGQVVVTELPTIPAPKSATGTTSSVADSATSVTVLASNANRKGATVYNDSTVALYLKLGATASATDFTIKLDVGDYYEVPFGYTGIIDGIWASNASGSARVTELT